MEEIPMRYAALPVLLLTAVSSCAIASPVLLTFSGTIGSDCPASPPAPAGCSTTGVGPVLPGDAFSGTAVWDPATIGSNLSFPDYALFTSFSLAFPAADGLTVGSIPNAQVLFAGLDFTGGNPATPLSIQVVIESTADNNFYSLFFPSTAQSCSGPICGFDVSNASFTQFAPSNTFNSTLAPVPEPGTGGIVLTGFGLVGAVGWMRGRRRWTLRRLLSCWDSTRISAKTA
jgi:hypothetical protein